MSYTLYISPNLNDFNEKNKNILKCFISFCIDFLKITIDFKIILVSSKDNIDGLSTAAYNPNTNDIIICCDKINGDSTNFISICRSFAHELVHLYDYMVKTPHTPYQNIGKYETIDDIIQIDPLDLENRANSLMGILCKTFVDKYNAKWIYNL